VAHTEGFTKTRKEMPMWGTAPNACMLYEYELALKELVLVSLSVFAPNMFGCISKKTLLVRASQNLVGLMC
jgi:hypothetical protein